MVHYPRAATTACCFSPTQMEQANLFENQSTRHGKRKYGGRVHYHYMTSNSSVEAYGGAKMVRSTMTEIAVSRLHRWSRQICSRTRAHDTESANTVEGYTTTI